MILLLLVASTRAEQGAARVMVELRQGEQYRQAEEYGTQQWRREDLPDRERAELAIQLALVYTEQALDAAPELRNALWSKADNACAALVDGWPENSRRSLVEVQRALVWLARGEQARQRPEIVQALDYFRVASRRLSDVAQAVGRELIELRLRPSSNRPRDSLSIQELESLEANISFQLARAQRQLGLCYPPRSADRDDALLQAVRRLTPLVQQTPPDELTWNARVELVACQRELGQSASARKLVSAWMQEKPPPKIAARLSADREVAAPPLAASDGRVEGFDGAWMDAANERKAGRQAAAAEQYRRLALGQPKHSRAAEAHRLAILCTADLLRETPHADRPASAASYEALLKEHLARWPAQESADEVRLWLGQLLAVRGGWPAAIDVLQQVRPKAPSIAESVQLLIHCYENRFRQSERSESAKLLSSATQYLQPIITGTGNRWPDPWSDLQRDTVLALARLHLRYSNKASPYAERLLAAALSGKPAVANPTKDRSWEAAARSLLVAALVKNGKTTEARAHVNQLADASAESLMEMLGDFDSQLASASPGGGERDLGELALVVVRLVDARRSELDASGIARLNAYRAAAVAATGDRAAALAQYAALAAQSPDDGEIQERYAALLAAADAPAEWRQAHARWQNVESRSRRGGPRWRRARRARIELLSRLGDRAEAEKLVRLTRLLYPDWDDGAKKQ
ncbi:MAG: hypothetical protein WD738_00610 [Pirellulales bacterium]